MRRSIREAIVGFSLVAAAAGGFGFWLWLRGVSLSRNTWSMQASFSDAAGLAARSPVTFRGVLVGNVRSVRVSDQAVVAELEIQDPKLRLARPVLARVASSSVLGGDAEVALMSGGAPLAASTAGPRDQGCDNRRIVCNGGRISGASAASLTSVTDSMQQLLGQADRQQLVTKLVAATATFEQTAREAGAFTRQAQVLTADIRRFLQGADGMVARIDQAAGGVNQAMKRTDPILTNLTAASADVTQTTRHVRNLAAALDNPRTVADLQATLTNARQLTARWDAVGGDINKLSGDPRFLQGLRSVSIGLGKFFDELYPAQTGAARDAPAPPATPTRPGD
ncbi:MAG: MlaD family protein [Cyanobacteriota bacterium]|nr:MlaD family protein [Cyanobacteriota bacterium]